LHNFLLFGVIWYTSTLKYSVCVTFPHVDIGSVFKIFDKVLLHKLVRFRNKTNRNWRKTSHTSTNILKFTVSPF